MNNHIAFVDDEQHVLDSYGRGLRSYSEDWTMSFHRCPKQVLEFMHQHQVDVLVSDVRMPVMSGIELLRKVRASDALNATPVIIVTGESDRALKREALDLDASDLLSKPADIEDLVARIRNVLRMKDYRDRLLACNEQLEQRVQERSAQLVAARNDLLWRLGKAAELRDEDTGNHVVRVACYSRIVAIQMGLDETFANNLFLAAPLHDVGKIGVADHILLKPGKLSNDEMALMQRHCEIGVSILSDKTRLAELAEQICLTGDAGTTRHDCPVLSLARIVAGSHHERFDGSGYPYGLRGTDIPLAGRIVAIADVFDALRSTRPYKPAFDLEKTLGILTSGSGSHFDPEVVNAFIEALDEILKVEEELKESGDGASKIGSSSFLQTSQMVDSLYDQMAS